MLRYLRLFSLFIKNSLQVDLEYRANFIGAWVFSVLDLVWSLGGTMLFYSFRERIGGWTFYEALLVIGLFFIMLGVNDVAIMPNVQGMSDHIRKGTFDFVLVKPLNSQIHGTLRQYKVHRISGIFSRRRHSGICPMAFTDRAKFWSNYVVCADRPQRHHYAVCHSHHALDDRLLDRRHRQHP